MQITVTQVYFEDEWQSSYGPMKGWYFGATTAGGEEGLFTINTKPTNTLAAGTSFDFEPSGQTVEKNGYVWQKGKRAQSSQGNPGRPQAQRPSGPANAPQTPSQQMSMSDAVALFKAINAELGVTPESGQSTTIFLGIRDGWITRPQPKPQPKLPLAQPKPQPPGYEQQEPEDDGNIPF